MGIRPWSNIEQPASGDEQARICGSASGSIGDTIRGSGRSSDHRGDTKPWAVIAQIGRQLASRGTRSRLQESELDRGHRACADFRLVVRDRSLQGVMGWVISTARRPRWAWRSIQVQPCAAVDEGHGDMVMIVMTPALVAASGRLLRRLLGWRKRGPANLSASPYVAVMTQKLKLGGGCAGGELRRCWCSGPAQAVRNLESYDFVGGIRTSSC